MVCIYCGGKTNIINSRPQKRLVRTWRRHACKACGAIFTTIEAPHFYESWRVRHSTGVLSPFERDMLFLSIYESLRHRIDAVSAATAITDTITANLIRLTDSGVLRTNIIVATALETLSRFDEAAKVHYAAYHEPTRRG